MKEDWTEVELREFEEERGKSLDPRKFPEETFDLYSVPSHSLGFPETVKGKEIGASKQVVDDQWVLLSRINPHLNRCWVIKSNSEKRKIASSEWIKFPPDDSFDPDYLGLYLIQNEVKNYMCANVSGVGGSLTRTNKEAVRNYPFRFPPLPEQKRIVAKIEALFTQLDEGVEKLKAAQDQLKTYRQSVLKAAFEGRLTNDDVPEGELPEGWEVKSSKDLFEYVTSGSRGWAKFYSEQGSLFIRITNLNFNTLEMDLSPDKIQRVSLGDANEGKRTKVEEGDLLISITGYLGMTAIVPAEIEEAYVNQHIALARPKTAFSSEYLGYYVSSDTGGLKQFNLVGRGATKAGLTLGDIKNLRVPIPATGAEQDKIVQEIEGRLSLADKMEESIATALQQSETLRQSILKKAFEGRLVEGGN